MGDVRVAKEGVEHLRVLDKERAPAPGAKAGGPRPWRDVDADKDGDNGLANAERYIPVEVRLEFYGMARLVNEMSQNKTTGDMSVKDGSGNTILVLDMTDGTTTLDRDPGVAS